MAATAAVSSRMAASRRVVADAGRLPPVDWRASRAARRCVAAADRGVPASFIVCMGTERSSGTARREVLSDGGGGRDQLGMRSLPPLPPPLMLETVGNRAAAALALVGAVDGRCCCCFCCAPALAVALVDEAADDIGRRVGVCRVPWLLFCVTFEFFDFFNGHGENGRRVTHATRSLSSARHSHIAATAIRFTLVAATILVGAVLTGLEPQSNALIYHGSCVTFGARAKKGAH